MGKTRDTGQDWLDWAEAKRDAAKERYAWVSRSAERTMGSYDTLISLIEAGMSAGARDACGRSRGDAAQAVGEVVGSLRYHAQRMASIPPKVAVQLAERLERAVGEL